MIDLTFRYGGELILVNINGNKVSFGNTEYGSIMADISGLKLSYDGVIKEFPDLQFDLHWREKAIDRFKQEIRCLRSERKVAEYIIEDLSKFGYIPHMMQVAGFRPVKL